MLEILTLQDDVVVSTPEESKVLRTLTGTGSSLQYHSDMPSSKDTSSDRGGILPKLSPTISQRWRSQSCGDMPNNARSGGYIQQCG
jgi:hypothetical protein